MIERKLQMSIDNDRSNIENKQNSLISSLEENLVQSQLDFTREEFLSKDYANRFDVQRKDSKKHALIFIPKTIEHCMWNIDQCSSGRRI